MRKLLLSLLLICLLCVGFAFALTDADITSAWKLDDLSAPYTDEKGVYDGQTNSSPVMTDVNCMDGNCQDFDNLLNNYIELSEMSSASAFSITAWVYENTSADTAREVIATRVDAGNGFWLAHVDGIQKGRFYVDAVASTTANNGFPPEDWILIGMTYNGSDKWTGFFNNTALTPIIDASVTHTNQLRLGGASDRLLADWNGWVDDVILWNKDIGTAGMAEIWNNQVGKFYKDFAVDTTPPIITQASVNLTSAINSDNQTIHQTDYSFYSITTDSTFTYIFDVDDVSRCAISKSDKNYTGMTDEDADTNCSGTADSQNQVCTVPVSQSASEGGNTFYLACINEDGYENATAQVSFNVHLDSTPPAITLTSPADDSWSNTKTVTFQATIVEQSGSIENVTLYDNETAWGNKSTNWTCVNDSACQITKTFTADGSYIWNFLAYDNHNNSGFGASNFTVNIDSTYPSISYNANTNSNGTWYSENYIFVNITASDTNNDTVTFEWEGTNETFDNNDSLSIYWENQTSLADGNYTFKAYINDSAGNENETLEREVYLDDTNPTISFVDPTTNSSNLSQSHITANVSVTEVNIDTINITVYNYSNGVKLNSSDCSSSPCFVNFTGFGDVEVYLNTTVNDSAGNTANTETRDIVLDEYPTVTTPEVYDSSGNLKTVFNISDTITVMFNTTDFRGGTYIAKSFLSIVDDLDIVRINNESPLEFIDYFTGSNGVMPDDWENITNSWEIWSNEFRPLGSGDYQRIALVNESTVANRTDVILKVNVKVDFSNEDSERLIFRYTDEDNYVALYMSETYSAFGIEEYIGGTRYFTEVGQILYEDTWYELKVVVQGDTAVGYLDGAERVTKTLSTSASGRIGLGADTGWIYYDDFTVGYLNSSKWNITDGYRNEFNYTIPTNVSLVGDWTITAYAENAEGHVSRSFTTITIASNEPVIQSITLYNSSLDEPGIFAPREVLSVQSDIIDSLSESNLDTALINITGANGTVRVTEGIMTNFTTISNGYTYEYNYTLPVENDAGTWTVTIWVNNSGGYTATDTKTFTFRDTSPQISDIITYYGAVEDTFFAHNEVVNIKFNVTDYEGASNISSTTLNLTYPNGTLILSNSSLDSSSITDGYSYEMNYTLSDVSGTYAIDVLIIDDDAFTSEKQQHFLVRWWDDRFNLSRDISLEEKYGIDRSNEQMGFRFTKTGVMSSCYEARFIDHYGVEIPYNIWKNTTTYCYYEFPVNVSANKNETYRMYYGNQSITNPNYASITFNRTIQVLDYKQWYNGDTGSNITFAKAVKVYDFDSDGTEEIFVFGRTHNATSMNNAFISVFNATFNSDTDVTMNWITNYTWFTDNHTFGYSLEIGDIDGVKIVTGGVAYNGSNNTAEICVFNYTEGVLERENCTTWGGTDGAEVFGVSISDVDNDGINEIITAGKTIAGSEYSELTIWNYSDGEFTLEDSDSWQLGVGKNSEAYYVKADEMLSGDGIDAKEIVVGGISRDVGDTINAHFRIYHHDGSSLTAIKEKSWYDGDLSETFSMDLVDVDHDGSVEILTSGNYYDGTRDISAFYIWRLWWSSPTYMLSEEGTGDSYYISGHSSQLTILGDDIDNDNITEIVSVGFANDGDYDRGLIRINNWNTTTLTLEKTSLYEKSTSIREGDFFDGAVITDLNKDGIKELLSVGRFGMTPPSATFLKTTGIVGIVMSLGAETDSEDPTVTFIDVTTNSSNLSQSFIEVNISATDNVGLDTINITLWNSIGKVNSTDSTSSPFEYNFTGLSEGNYSLNATANDTSGNVGNTETRQIILDTTAPVVSFVMPSTNDSNVSQTFIEVNISATDLYFEEINITLWNSSYDKINSTNSGSSPYFFNFTNLTEGIYYINATANDTSGNEGSTSTREIRLDSHEPYVNLISPADGYSSSSGDITFTFNVSDNLITDISCSLLINNGSVSSGSFTNGTNSFAYTLGGGTHTWAVSCTDGVNTNTTDSRSIIIEIAGGSAPGGGGGAPPAPEVPINITEEVIVEEEEEVIEEVEFIDLLKEKIEVAVDSTSEFLDDVKVGIIEASMVTKIISSVVLILILLVVFWYIFREKG